MPTKKKKFIDKRHAVSFRLIHRSQRDPLAVDENAPQHVLVPSVSKEETEKRKEEQRKFGVYFDDDYNYLQHLKDASSVPEWEPVLERVRINKDDFPVQDSHTKTTSDGHAGIKLPSSVFASALEEEEGYLYRKATHGPHPEWDPDIVAALDDDFDFDNPENQLEDDFVAFADEEEDVGEDGDDEMAEDDNSWESDFDAPCNNLEDDFVTRANEYSASGAKKSSKSYLSDCSLTSSVLPRSEALRTLDERFEKILEEYDDLEIGSLDDKEIEGYLPANNEMVARLAEEFAKQEKFTLKKFLEEREEELNVGSKTLSDNSVDEELERMKIVEVPKEDRFDCESILSTYSNLYNHPKLIRETKSDKSIKMCPKMGIPVGVLNESGLTKRNLKKFEDSQIGKNKASDAQSRITRLSVATTIRSKHETSEEKRNRKAEVKLYRRERRMEKKANQQAFKIEEKRQKQIMQNLRQNLQGVKLS